MNRPDATSSRNAGRSSAPASVAVFPRFREKLGDVDPSAASDLAVAGAAALAAGRAVARCYRALGRDVGSVAVDQKGPDDPVTDADRSGDRAAHAVLAGLRPDDDVRSEESAERKGRPLTDRLWVVDPLDGTKEFLARNGQFAVMVGLAVGGEARVGALFRPDPGTLFLGAVGEGAWRADVRIEPGAGPEGCDPETVGDPLAEAPLEGELGGDGARRRLLPAVQDELERLALKPLDATAPREGPLRLVHSRSHTPDEIEALAESLREQGEEVELLALGSAGVKCATVAAGVADLYVHPVPYLQEWDTCAPEAVLRGAGGRVTDCRGDPLRYGKKDTSQPHGLFAGRAEVWERVRDQVRTFAP